MSDNNNNSKNEKIKSNIINSVDDKEINEKEQKIRHNSEMNESVNTLFDDTDNSSKKNDEEKDDVNINSIEDLESTKIPKKRKVNFKKIITILIIIICVILLRFLIVYFLNPYNASKDKNIKSPTSSSIGFNVDESENQGMVKRILGNKFIVSPDDGTEDQLLYVSKKLNTNDIHSGDYIDYRAETENGLPTITYIRKIQKGKVIYKGIMTLSVDDSETNENSESKTESSSNNNNNVKKYLYDEDLNDQIRSIVVNDTIEFLSEKKDNNLVITKILKVNNKTGTDITNPSSEVSSIPDIPVANGSVFKKSDFENEYGTINNRQKDPNYQNVKLSDLKDNKVTFYNKMTQPIWIRTAWRNSSVTGNTPDVGDVKVSLITPSGKEISEKNISQFGRYWIDENIINFAIKNPEVGEWNMKFEKSGDLGEIEMNVMGLNGFITINKFGANLIDKNHLEMIWNIGGIPDDGLELDVYLQNDKFSTLIYHGSSKTEELHIVDKRTVDISNIPKGKYNIYVKAKDIDIKTHSDVSDIPENTLQVTAETIVDQKNVGILILQ